MPYLQYWRCPSLSHVIDTQTSTQRSAEIVDTSHPGIWRGQSHKHSCKAGWSSPRIDLETDTPLTCWLFSKYTYLVNNLFISQSTLWILQTSGGRFNIDGLTQDCSNSSAYALELPQFCVKPSMWCCCLTWIGNLNVKIRSLTLGKTAVIPVC